MICVWKKNASHGWTERSQAVQMSIMVEMMEDHSRREVSGWVKTDREETGRVCDYIGFGHATFSPSRAPQRNFLYMAFMN